MLKQKLWIFFVLAACLSLNACAFAPVERPKVDHNRRYERTYQLDLAQTFQAAKQAADTMGYGIQSSDQDLGEIVTFPKQIKVGGNADCGTWNGSPISGNVASTLEIRVEKAGKAASRVHLEHLLKGQFTGRNLYGMVTRQERYFCASHGVVERQYLAVLDEIVSRKEKEEKAQIPEPPSINSKAPRGSGGLGPGKSVQVNAPLKAN